MYISILNLRAHRKQLLECFFLTLKTIGSIKSPRCRKRSPLDIPNYVTNINLKCLHEGISCARNFKGGFQLVISHSSSEADLFSSAFLETVSMVYVVSVCLPLQLKRCLEGLKQNPALFAFVLCSCFMFVTRWIMMLTTLVFHEW